MTQALHFAPLTVAQEHAAYRPLEVQGDRARAVLYGQFDGEMLRADRDFEVKTGGLMDAVGVTEWLD